MKHAIYSLLAFSVIAMFVISPVAAATSQGLEWGFVLGDRFEFTLSDTEENLNEQIVLNITKMPVLAIPDPLEDWSDIPAPEIGFWWANDTSMGISTLIFIGLVAVGSKIALPIGNFTLLGDLVAVKLTGEQIIDQTNVWGIEWTQPINATHDYRLSATYAKADGFLADYKLELVISASNTVVESITVTRNNLPSVGGFDLGNITQLIQDNILYVGAGIAVLIILGIACKKR